MDVVEGRVISWPPPRPLASSARVSFVEVSPSTEMLLNDLDIACVRRG